MRSVINFNRKWAFTKMADAVPETMPTKWDFVNIPHSWNAIDGQDGDNDFYRGTCYYAKQFMKASLPAADRYYLEINGANSSADVYVNGKNLAHHDGGYSTWRVDITEALDMNNLLVIAVDNKANEVVYPQMADFTFYGGIYRDVNIIAVSESHFDLDYYGGPGIAVTPVVKENNAEVGVEVFVTNKTDDQVLLYRIKDAEGNVVGSISSEDTAAVFEIENVHLWHGRKDPYLYTAEVALVEGETVVDAVTTRFGCRTFEIDPDNGFILNGEEYLHHGVLVIMHYPIPIYPDDGIHHEVDILRHLK